MIAQCDPRAGYLAHKGKIDAAISRVLKNGWYILGQEVQAFEQAFAEWLKTAHAVGVANGTDAIELALRAAGIGLGDAVATVSHTAVATVSAIRRCGAIPQFVDIDPEYFTMDIDSLLEVIELRPNIKAIVVVHLYGQMADMPIIVEIARQHNLIVIEDCAQAHGAVLDGKKAGTWSDFGCFSFYPTKNMGALGDGGAVVTDNGGWADRLRALRQYGWDRSRNSQLEGVNSRLDALQAAILSVRLTHLDQDNAERRRIAAQYRSGIKNHEEIVLPAEREGGEHVYHQFVIRCKDREAVIKELTKAGIGWSIHYPRPVHLQPAYTVQSFTPVPLLNTETICISILSLPMFPQLSATDITRVLEVLDQRSGL